MWTWQTTNIAHGDRNPESANYSKLHNKMLRNRSCCIHFVRLAFFFCTTLPGFDTASGIWCEQVIKTSVRQSDRHSQNRFSKPAVDTWLQLMYFQISYFIVYRIDTDTIKKKNRLQWKRKRKILQCFHCFTVSSLIQLLLIFLASIQTKTERSRKLLGTCCMLTDCWQ